MPPNMTMLYLVKKGHGLIKKTEAEDNYPQIKNNSNNIYFKSCYIQMQWTHLMSLWLVSMCCRKCGPWTQYLRRTTQPILVILDKMPSVSTLCMEALSLVHCIWWPSASSHPLTIWYPAWGSLDLMALTSVSRASSVMVEYRLLTDILCSCILL